LVCLLNLMKRITPPDDTTRFSGSLRHYHRSGAQTQRSWDDWVEGSAGKTRGSRNMGKILGVILGAIALLGIVTGLIIELR
jgi:hypothetical protein